MKNKSKNAKNEKLAIKISSSGVSSVELNVNLEAK